MNNDWNVMVPELTVLNFDESLKFYTKGLGFQIKYQRANPAFAYLAYEEHIQIMIEAHHETGWNTDELLYPLGRGVNLQMEVKNVEELVDKLKMINYPPYRDPRFVEYLEGDLVHRQKELLVQDPNGYLLRFCEVQM